MNNGREAWLRFGQTLRRLGLTDAAGKADADKIEAWLEAHEGVVVIEDSVAGVAAARAAGMRVFGFVGASHFSRPDEGADLTAAGAELIFDDMARLPDLVAARAARVGAD